MCDGSFLSILSLSRRLSTNPIHKCGRRGLTAPPDSLRQFGNRRRRLLATATAIACTKMSRDNSLPS
jgi:hypothetical protein